MRQDGREHTILLLPCGVFHVSFVAVRSPCFLVACGWLLDSCILPSWLLGRLLAKESGEPFRPLGSPVVYHFWHWSIAMAIRFFLVAVVLFLSLLSGKRCFIAWAWLHHLAINKNGPVVRREQPARRFAKPRPSGFLLRESA